MRFLYKKEEIETSKYMRNGIFDPDNITNKDMSLLADAIDEFITLLTEVMIFPKDMKKSEREMLEEAIKRSKKLIKKLRNGDKGVFKDSDDWNPLE